MDWLFGCLVLSLVRCSFDGRLWFRFRLDGGLLLCHGFRKRFRRRLCRLMSAFALNSKPGFAARCAS